MSYASTVLADSPLGYWRLGEASGTVMADASGNAHPGTYSAGTLGTAGLLTGDSDTALSTTGKSASVPNGTWMDTGSALSVEMWIKPNAAAISASFVTIFCRDDGGSNMQWRLGLASGKIRWAINTSTGGQLFVAGSTTMVAGSTYHVVATYDGTNIRAYLNGTQDLTSAKTGTLTTLGQPLTIGARGDSGESYSGVIDEAAVYGTALSLTKVQTHYSIGTGQLGPGEAAAYSWVGGDGTIAAISDTSNKQGGYEIDGYAVPTVTIPDAAAPAIWTPTAREDLALWLPPPTVVDGRIQ